MPFNIGPIELIFILAVALVVVGPRRLPEMGNAVGKTIREFRKASSEIGEVTSLEPEVKPEAAPQPNTLHEEAVSDTPTAPTPTEPTPTAPAVEAKTDDDA
ncbi:MAG: twin-arginine translocase TatA/TatE family subunit [Chloroflexota bacterium]|nr:twin-arginine translocase TatA/TatE family subunit [Chloroflexota bacterium]